LTAQFHGFTSAAIEHTLTEPNSNELAEDFSHASSRRSKTVRFSDTPTNTSGELLEPYQDDPNSDSAGYRDQAVDMTNQQLHQYHSQILEEQDEQLDRLGESIGRQRHISMQIGDELESHVAMLDEMDDTVDRHQSRLDRAKVVLGKVAKGAGENKQMTAIVVLIIILILLIAILK
jgi:syntaxin 8